MEASPLNNIVQSLSDSSSDQDGPLPQLASLGEENVSISEQTRPPDFPQPPSIPLLNVVPVQPQSQQQPQHHQHGSAARDPAHSTMNNASWPLVRDPVTHQRVALLLDQQRAQYSQQRDHFETIVDNIFRTTETAIDNESMEELRTLRTELHGTNEDLKLHEGRIRELEHETCGSSFSLDQDEEVFYASEPAIAPVPPVASHNASQHSTLPPPISVPAPPLTELSTATEIHEARQEIEFLVQRIEDLDYEHLKDIEFRQIAREEGDPVHPPDPEFYETHETDRASLKDKLAQARRRVHELEEQMKQSPAQHSHTLGEEMQHSNGHAGSKALKSPNAEEVPPLGTTEAGAKPVEPGRPRNNRSMSLYCRIMAWMASMRST